MQGKHSVSSKFKFPINIGFCSVIRFLFYLLCFKIYPNTHRGGGVEPLIQTVISHHAGCHCDGLCCTDLLSAYHWYSFWTSLCIWSSKALCRYSLWNVFLVIVSAQGLFCSVSFLIIFLLLSLGTQELWRPQIGFPQLVKWSLLHLLPPMLLLSCWPTILFVAPFWIQGFSASFVIFSDHVQGIRDQGLLFLDSPQCIWICFAVPWVSTLGERVVWRFSRVLESIYLSQLMEVQKGCRRVVKHRLYFKLNSMNLHLS